MAFHTWRSLPGCTWPPLVNQNVAQVWSAYLQLCQTQYLPPEEIERNQLAQFRSVLAHSIRHVPYYARVLSAAGIEPQAIQTMADFRRIPLLGRVAFQQASAEFPARSLPNGTRETGASSTSGSSGVPVTVRKTNMVQLWFLAFYLRDIEWNGIDPTGIIATIRATGAKGQRLEQLLKGAQQEVWAPQLRPLLVTGRSFTMDIHQDPVRQLQFLRQVNPNYLLSYAMNLEILADLLRQGGTRLPNLRVIQNISETLTDDGRQRIESAFGVPVKNTYSCNEAGYLASPCPRGHGLHVHAENVILEVLDEENRPCGPGQTGRVVLTTLSNYLTPLIRYDIMDEAEVGPQPCPCGRGLPLLTKVLGRMRPPMVLPDGRRKYSGNLVMHLRELGGHSQQQLIQKTVDHLVVKLIPNRDWTADHAERLRGIVQQFFEAPVRVDVEEIERFELPPGGKLKNVVSELAI